MFMIMIIMLFVVIAKNGNWRNNLAKLQGCGYSNILYQGGISILNSAVLVQEILLWRRTSWSDL